jgi:hypothetical protein
LRDWARRESIALMFRTGTAVREFVVTFVPVQPLGA